VSPVDAGPLLGDVLATLRQLERWCVQADSGDPRRFVALAKVLGATMRGLERSADPLTVLFAVAGLVWREAMAMTMHHHEAADVFAGAQIEGKGGMHVPGR
jgi:hypothetical protein